MLRAIGRAWAWRRRFGEWGGGYHSGHRHGREVIGAFKRHGLIDGALRTPEPGAPYAYVTTKKLLKVFGLVSLRDLPDIEKLEDAGLLQRTASESVLDDMLGIADSEAMDGVGDTDDETPSSQKFHSAV